MDSEARQTAVLAEAETTHAAEIGAPADARLRAVLDLVADFYWEQDENGRFTFLRAREGYRPEPMLDALLAQPPFGSPAPSADHAAVGGVEEPAAFHDLVRSFEHTELGPRRIAFSGAPVRDADGKLRGFAGIARDVTER